MTNNNEYQAKLAAERASHQAHLQTQQTLGQMGVNTALKNANSSLPKTPVNYDPNKKS